MRKMWSFLLAALALTGCAAAPADALPAAETAETAEMTATETEEAAAQPVGFTVGNLSEVPNTCGGYWGWNTATPIMRLHGWMMKMTRKACTPCC